MYMYRSILGNRPWALMLNSQYLHTWVLTQCTGWLPCVKIAKWVFTWDTTVFARVGIWHLGRHHWTFFRPDLTSLWHHRRNEVSHDIFWTEVCHIWNLEHYVYEEMALYLFRKLVTTVEVLHVTSKWVFPRDWGRIIAEVWLWTKYIENHICSTR